MCGAGIDGASANLEHGFQRRSVPSPMPFAVGHLREVPTLDSHDRAGLDELGWNERLASAFDDLHSADLQPGRLAADYSSRFLVQLAGAAP